MGSLGLLYWPVSLIVDHYSFWSFFGKVTCPEMTKICVLAYLKAHSKYIVTGYILCGTNSLVIFPSGFSEERSLTVSACSSSRSQKLASYHR